MSLDATHRLLTPLPHLIGRDPVPCDRYRGFKLNIWDVGGQTSLRSYWRNYFEETDGLIWVVDSSDRARLHDCKAELELLLGQEVWLTPQSYLPFIVCTAKVYLSLIHI